MKQLEKQAERVKKSPLFDAEWYVSTYKDVEISGIEPALHYLLFGVYLERAPSSTCSFDKFLNEFPNLKRECADFLWEIDGYESEPENTKDDVREKIRAAEKFSKQKLWLEAVSAWRNILENVNPRLLSGGVYERLVEAYKAISANQLAEDVARMGIARHPDHIGLALHLVDMSVERADWEEGLRWAKVLDLNSKKNEQIAGKAKFYISTLSRLANLDQYRVEIKEYLSERQRKTNGTSSASIVVYTAICGNYESVKLPEKLDSKVDYVLFSDTAVPDVGVFSVRPIPYFHADPTRMARFVKTHPHLLLPEYEIAIWVDSNIVLRGDISKIVDKFIDSQEVVGAIPHPRRKSIYEEVAACIEWKKDSPELMNRQADHYKNIGFDCDDLIETNFILFDLRDSRVRKFLDIWWREIDLYSKRDQLSVNYALAEASISYHRIMRVGESARNHSDFILSPHFGEHDLSKSLLQALHAEVVTPNTGASYSSIREERIRKIITENVSIDVIVCVHNALIEVQRCLESVDRSRGERGGYRLIVVDDGSDNPTKGFLEDFCGHREWATLIRHEKAHGYTKAANIGLRASDADVMILLNSDTIVTASWAEKLADVLVANPDVGIVGPMSNAASHQSLPSNRSIGAQTAINEIPRSLSVEVINGFCERWSTETISRVQLVHGFCFCIHRRVIESVGYFDEENFPRGYGEENDYCLRAANAGFGLAVATHTYVFHEKSKSYKTVDRVTFMRDGSLALKKIHGSERVSRAVKSMQSNPVFESLRKKSWNLYLDAIRRSGGVAIGAITQTRTDGQPTSSGFIRLIQPLTHSRATDSGLHFFYLHEWEASAATEFDVIIVQRTAISELDVARELIDRIRKAGAKLVIDIDDAFSLIDPRHSQYDFYKSKNSVLEFLLRHADLAWFSTLPVLDAYRHTNVPSQIVPNCLDDRIWSVGFRGGAFSNLDGKIRFLYMGTTTHDRDFDVVVQAFDVIMERYAGRFEVYVIGALRNVPQREWLKMTSVPQGMTDYPSFSKWLQEQGPFDFGLAPLESTPLNRCKSDLKFLEYSALGITSIVSRLDPYLEAGKEGFAVMTEHNLDSWITTLTQVIEDPAHYRGIASRAQEYVKARRNIEVCVDMQLASIEKILSSSPIWGRRTAKIASR